MPWGEWITPPVRTALHGETVGAQVFGKGLSTRAFTYRTFGGPVPWAQDAAAKTWTYGRWDSRFWWWDGPAPGGDGTSWGGGPAYSPTPAPREISGTIGYASQPAGYVYISEGGPYYRTEHQVRIGSRAIAINALGARLARYPVAPGDWPARAIAIEHEEGIADVLGLTVQAKPAAGASVPLQWHMLLADDLNSPGPGYHLTDTGWGLMWMTDDPNNIIARGPNVSTSTYPSTDGAVHTVASGTIAAAKAFEDYTRAIRPGSGAAGLLFVSVTPAILAGAPPTPGGEPKTVSEIAGGGLQFTATVQSVRYRFLYPYDRGRPLRQVQRDDGLALGGPRQIGTRSVQSSIRQLGYQ